MIVAAIGPEQPGASKGFFDAIAAKCQREAAEYRVVTQPDHAKLSGEFAAAVDRGRMPYVTDEIVRAVAAHDIGWLAIDGAAPNPILPPYEANGRLRSFLTTMPDVFLDAWVASIAQAERIGPAAGTMVSQHFERLAQFRLQRQEDGPEETARLHSFLAMESARQKRLRESRADGSTKELLMLLQFCDLISLYLCCGLESRQELAQEFGFGKVEISRDGEVVKVSGVPLRKTVVAECPAFLWRPGSPTLVPSAINVNVVPV